MKIPNKLARHIAIASSGLGQSPATTQCDAKELLSLIKYLGYVQQDPIQVVARAHDHILWSRNRHYRPDQLDSLLKDDRLVFEHFCHDACVLPMSTLPYWGVQFQRKGEQKEFKGGSNLLDKKGQKALLARIKKEGPLCSRDFKATKPKTERAVWSKSPHKRTLDYLWLTGVLAVAKREKFTKYYDLAERVYPARVKKISKAGSVHWLASHALDRLGFANAAEMKGFWDAYTLEEAKQWSVSNHAKLIDVLIETNNKAYKDAFMHRTMNAKSIEKLPLPKQIKILNPFDPLIRDRKRLLYLFGFDYRIEMYVPPAKRQYGYYVYPLLEFDTFIGRIEIRHDRVNNFLCVDNLWPEPGVKFGKQRMAKLNSELEKLRKFCGADMVQWL